jgi:hypothetical protein
MDTAPVEAARRIAETAQRLAASADVHRRLHDPTLFRRGLETVLNDVVSSVIDRRTVTLTFNIAPLDLTFDQMSAITMLVIEAANNAQKHVFQHGLGSKLTISLNGTASGKATLKIQDDGPGKTSGEPSKEAGLGLRIVEDLVGQIAGRIATSQEDGTEISIEFPLRHR